MVGKELKPFFYCSCSITDVYTGKGAAFHYPEQFMPDFIKNLVHGFESITVIAIFKESADLRI